MAADRCGARLRKYLLEKAKMHAVARDWENAFSHYLLAIKVDCTTALEIEAAFAFCFEQWLTHLRGLQQEDEIGNAFVRAKAVCFLSDSLMSLLAHQAIRLGQQTLAIDLLQEAMSSFPSSLKVAEAWEHVSYDAVERWHFRMLNDGSRNQNYHDAILQTVKEHNIKTVLDIGCGTGLLSLYALEAGAASVAMCDAAHVMSGICTAVISENCKPATSSRCLLFTKHSTSLSIPDGLPTCQDLLVTEIFDVALFGEQCLPTLLHAWSHLLYNSPDKKSQIIPRGAKMYVCAIQCEEIRRENFVHLQNVPLLNLAMLNILGKTALVEGDPYTSENLFFIRNSYRLLSPIQHLLWIDFSNPEALEALTHHSHQLALDVSTDGCVDALAVWFDLHLTEGLTVSTQPSARGCWEQAIFPVMMKTESLSGTYYTPAVVKTGDQLQVECKVRNNCLHMELLKVNSSGFFVKPSPADFSTPIHNHVQHQWRDFQKHSSTDNPKNGSLLGNLHLTVSKTLGEKENAVCASSYNRREISNKTCCCETKCADTGLYEMCYYDTNHHKTKRCYNINSGHHLAVRRVASIGPESNLGPPSEGTENILTCGENIFLHTSGDSPDNIMSSPTGMVCPVNVESSITDSEQHIVCKDGTDIVCSVNVEGSTTDSKHDIAYKVRTDSCSCCSLDEKREAVHEQTCNHLRTSQDGGHAGDMMCVHQDTFFIEREVIRQLNNLKCNTLFQTAVHYARTKVHSQGRVLHLSAGFPLVGLLALKQGFQHACLHVHPDLDGAMRHDLQMLACCIAQRNNISGEEWSWWERGDPVIGDETVDVIVADLVDVNGSLDCRLVEELFTFSCILNQEGLVIPQKVDIFAVLIDSSQLQSMSFASDSNTLGYSISTHINAFKTRTFLELDIHTLPHKELTDVCHIFHLNLQSAILAQDSSSMRAHRLEVEFSQSRQLPVRVRKTGQATAIVFWFNLTLAPGIHLCTLDAATHWKQAAFVLDARQVTEGDEIILEARLGKSFLHFQLL